MDKKCRLNFELFTLSRENEKKEIYFGKKNNLPSQRNVIKERIKNYFPSTLRTSEFAGLKRINQKIKNEIRFWRGWGEEKIFHHGSLNLNG